MASLIVVGSIALDTITTPSHQEKQGLGGSATYFSAAAGLLSEPQVIAVLGEDFRLEELDFLRSRGVNLSQVKVGKGKTFQWQGSYGDDLGEATTLRTDLNVFAEFKPQLSESQKNCDFLFLGNILPQLQWDVLEQAENARFVAADTMNLWINNENAMLRKVLSRINMIVINEAEAKLLSNCSDIRDAARAIRQMGPEIIVIKRGAFGSFMLHEERMFLAPAYLGSQVIDPTGAGDTFAGGLMGTLARFGSVTNDNLRRGIITGTALASFTIEEYSLGGLKRVTLESLRERYALLQEMMRFPDFD
ncbi:MAG: PfkB family carbohydrate kinase [Bradymonadales bacterium]|jgi:sugar/nucleoside kinase (ribokinase family)